MPLVFVHGVSNRDTPEYRDNQLARDAFFRALVFPKLGVHGEAVKIFDPFWGDEGVKFRWGNASLPESFEAMETFGAALDPADLRIGADVVSGMGPRTTDLLQVAQHALTDAVELVWSAALPAAKTADAAAALAESYGKAIDYALAHPKPAWLANAKSENFVDILLHTIQTEEAAAAAGATTLDAQWESFGAGGLLDELKEGVSRITSVGAAGLSSIVTTLGRKKAHLGASLFIGDVFQYLNTRGDKDHPGPITKKILADMHTALDMRTSDDPKLIVVGHSLGGVISYDLLTTFDPRIEVDVFVSVGSQVALFEEMTLYKASRSDLPAHPPQERLARPANIKRWVNVLDPNDIFSFRAEGVFEGVIDFKYETGFGLMEAHSGYFRRPSFYRRLGERLAQP